MKRWPNCTCLTCDKDFHSLGIARHRAMHRDKKEDCDIVLSDGRLVTYKFSNSQGVKE